MRALTLGVLVVLGCGNVTADPKDGAAGAGGAQAAAGAAGGAGELGGRGAGGDIHEQTGGAGGQLQVDAGVVMTGPCAGLCSNPIAIAESGHQQMTVNNSPLGSCYAITTTPATILSFSCAGSNPGACGYSSITVNGRPTNCAGSLSSSNFTQPGPVAGQDCVVFAACSPSAVVGFY
jgi:hypothetical protein